MNTTGMYCSNVKIVLPVHGDVLNFLNLKTVHLTPLALK